MIQSNAAKAKDGEEGEEDGEGAEGVGGEAEPVPDDAPLMDAVSLGRPLTKTEKR